MRFVRRIVSVNGKIGLGLQGFASCRTANATNHEISPITLVIQRVTKLLKVDVMQGNIIERLFASFGDLERAIGSARETLAKKGEIPSDILQRLDSYDGILIKQRNLAASLCESINRGDWDEVSRNVTLINGLSAMIRDDARQILSSLSLNSDHKQEDEDFNFC